jgi:hypothetical protein
MVAGPRIYYQQRNQDAVRREGIRVLAQIAADRATTKTENKEKIQITLFSIGIANPPFDYTGSGGIKREARCEYIQGRQTRNACTIRNRAPHFLQFGTHTASAFTGNRHQNAWTKKSSAD